MVDVKRVVPGERIRQDLGYFCAECGYRCRKGCFLRTPNKAYLHLNSVQNIIFTQNLSMLFGSPYEF